ncbi:VanZ family protein [Kitasatospora sp. NPDC092948]|uniref:VanZ family protein n=1 Tax=Kitasatospora sp. NPDC092948 TaxID=3364088 RepID=UPI003825BBDF
MISAVLNGNAGLIPVFLVLALLLGAAAWWSAGRRGLPRWSAVLLGVSLAGELAATLYPTMSGGSQHPNCAWGASLGFTLNSTQGQLNLLMYVPLGLFAVLTFGRPVLVSVGVLALTGVTETVQGLLPAIGRACDSGDLAANALGGLIGVLLGCAVRLARRRRIRPGGRELAFSSALAVAIGAPVLALQFMVLEPTVATGLSAATRAQRELAAHDAELLFGPGTRVIAVQDELDGPGIERVIVTLDHQYFTLDWPSGRLLNLGGFLLPEPDPDPATDQQARQAADRFLAQWHPDQNLTGEPQFAPRGGDGGRRRFTYAYDTGPIHVDVDRTNQVVAFGQD